MWSLISKSKRKNELYVEYENLADELIKIAKFLPFHVSNEKIDLAKKSIYKKYNYWSNNKSFLSNLKYNFYRLYYYTLIEKKY